jgi:predicted nucleotidyltransferase
MEQITGLGERIKARRREVGLTAARLAAAAGVTENAIRKLESGDSAGPRFLTGVRIAEALELSSDELAGRITSSGGAPELAKVIAAIRTVRDALENEGVEHLDVFGSVARGDATAKSDVDVIVTPRQGARYSLFNLTSTGNYLEDALARKVDIVTLDTALNSRRLRGVVEESVRAF